MCVCMPDNIGSCGKKPSVRILCLYEIGYDDDVVQEEIRVVSASEFYDCLFPRR